MVNGNMLESLSVRKQARDKGDNMSKNANLRSARDTKNDEFYTQISDIEKELKHYKKHFKDAIVFCNCDDPEWSNFWKYFHLNFAHLGLKKLITTFYHIRTSVYKMEYTGGDDNNISAGVKIPLTGNGDFRSDECIETLKESDIVVTNCPFSLFREYVAQLIEYEKKFLIIGNQNAITYKEIFPLFKDNVIWMGYHNGDMSFTVPDDSEQRVTRFWIDSNGQKWRSIGNVMWVTNIDIQKRHEKLHLDKSYTPEKYPVFDELPQIINVDKISDIPCDYEGYMAVPITFLNKYNPEQFEIIDGLNRYTILDVFGVNADVLRRHSHCCNINGKSIYYRIVIRKK